MDYIQPARTICIGDIHGCSIALQKIIECVQPGWDDRVVLLGDYVDRGPDTRGVIEQVWKLQDCSNVIALQGNHELMLLRAFHDSGQLNAWLQFGGVETLASYGGGVESIPPDHIDFFRNCRSWFETETHIFMHANYDPGLPLGRQPQALLFWQHLADELPPPHCSGKIAVVGHMPQPDGKILDAGHLICLDTHCYDGGWLTAMDLQTGRYWQSNQEGVLREGESHDGTAQVS